MLYALEPHLKSRRILNIMVRPVAVVASAEVAVRSVRGRVAQRHFTAWLLPAAQIEMNKRSYDPNIEVCATYVTLCL